MPFNNRRQFLIALSKDPEFKLSVPDAKTVEEWMEQGVTIGRAVQTLGWLVGEWWNAGEKWGRRVEIVNDPLWKGPSAATCRNYATIAGKFEVSRRHDSLSFEHHAAVAALPREQADALLTRAAEEQSRTGQAPPARQLRQWAKTERRDTREVELAEATVAASKRVGHTQYGVIYADPPWRYEPWARQTGMDRAADNHYPTMTTAEINSLPVTPGDDAVLFLWRTAPMLEAALEVMRAWGFTYKTEIVWVKNRVGTGYWVRNQHEVLMIGTRGSPPPPAPGKQYASVLEADVGDHSVKPPQFATMIEKMFPSAMRLEMFARQHRPGWDIWGAEAPTTEPQPEQEKQHGTRGKRTKQQGAAGRGKGVAGKDPRGAPKARKRGN